MQNMQEGRQGIWKKSVSLAEATTSFYKPLCQRSFLCTTQYNPAEETADSSHIAFTTAFPRGFAVEILQVYSGPPVIVYKFRHWGYMEGPFKGHAPTGEMVELFGIGIFEVSSCNFLIRA